MKDQQPDSKYEKQISSHVHNLSRKEQAFYLLI